jgi:hypothetical protein
MNNYRFEVQYFATMAFVIVLATAVILIVVALN